MHWQAFLSSIYTGQGPNTVVHSEPQSMWFIDDVGTSRLVIHMGLQMYPMATKNAHANHHEKSDELTLRVIAGRAILTPSNSLDIFTQQPNLDVSVKPKAKSSMSFSSSSGSGISS